jgi:hypothetical protein
MGLDWIFISYHQTGHFFGRLKLKPQIKEGDERAMEVEMSDIFRHYVVLHLSTQTQNNEEK